ncbi:hypothetical protein [Glutamicibacter sp.]|uniref:hypothetical protein n=1 Tax=Glutamicibacter sp. TaxID=1931995 RepID=UPI002B491369|nr:hypothetical protein [Glutamicibacter sp.]HJX77298.1 hypothetical protein [Glutamicibacter sp.]
MTMPTSRELSYKDRVTFIENLFTDYFREHGNDDFKPEFLNLQARVWNLAKQRPSDVSCMNILGLINWRAQTHTRSLWDDETQDDYRPEDEGYKAVLEDHLDNQEQVITGHIQQLIRR